MPPWASTYHYKGGGRGVKPPDGQWYALGMEKGKQPPYYILHGYNGRPGEHWFPWLKAELEEQGEQVVAPEFPNASLPDLKPWLMVLKEEIKKNGEGTIIGHSLGGTLAMRYVEIGGKPQRVILVASPFEKLIDIPQISNFLEEPFDIPAQALIDTEFMVLGSEDDPFVPIDHAQKWADLLNVKPRIFKDKGHFGEDTFPEILDCL